MSKKSHFEFIVIGGGVVGSATAYHLRKECSSSRALLLEQFPLGHTRGSSHGHSRLLRKAYPAHHWYYAKMVPEALQQYHQLEEESGDKLFRKTGVLNVCFDPKVAASSEKAMQQSGVDYTKLDRKGLLKEYPMVGAEEGSQALVEEESGVLYADKCVKALQKVFLEMGGEIQDSEQVLDIAPGHIVTVRTNKANYTCDKLIITAGSWAPKVLKPLGLKIPLQPERVTVLYWREKTPGMFGADRFPCLRYIAIMDKKHNLYGTPSDEYPGLFKFCYHDGIPADPDSRDKNAWDKDIKFMCEFVAKYLPDLESKPSIIERCFYTMTPDEDYVLDTHPRWDNIVIGAGFSGHGFKLGILSGWILKELANGRRPEKYQMDKFSIKRFSDSKLISKL